MYKPGEKKLEDSALTFRKALSAKIDFYRDKKDTVGKAKFAVLSVAIESYDAGKEYDDYLCTIDRLTETITQIKNDIDSEMAHEKRASDAIQKELDEAMSYLEGDSGIRFVEQSAYDYQYKEFKAGYDQLEEVKRNSDEKIKALREKAAKLNEELIPAIETAKKLRENCIIKKQKLDDITEKNELLYKMSTTKPISDTEDFVNQVIKFNESLPKVSEISKPEAKQTKPSTVTFFIKTPRIQTEIDGVLNKLNNQEKKNPQDKAKIRLFAAATKLLSQYDSKDLIKLKKLHEQYNDAYDKLGIGYTSRTIKKVVAKIEKAAVAHTAAHGPKK